MTAKRLKAPYYAAFFRVREKRLPPRFGIVTAHNPRGRKAPPAANRRRDAALRRRLDALGVRRFRVVGGDESGSHREAGWGVAAPRAVIRALAERFDQDAYYWVSGGRIGLGSAAGGALERAGTWSARAARW